MKKDSRKKATIYDLSMLSGISPSTVSAVLNGTWRKRRIKESTAHLIRDLAEKHQVYHKPAGPGIAQFPLRIGRIDASRL